MRTESLVASININSTDNCKKLRRYIVRRFTDFRSHGQVTAGNDTRRSV
jgi:hypothetical protein